MPRIFDGFTYNGEHELLDLRIRELSRVVDGFALVMSDRNFRGEERPYPAQASLANEYQNLKIFALKAPEGPHPTVDFYQRGKVGTALMSFAPERGDLLMLSDVDEIPNREVLAELARKPMTTPVCLIQNLFYYRPCWLQAQPWLGTVVWPFTGTVYNTQDLRNQRASFPLIPKGGWHFSYFGSAEKIARKIRSLDIAADARCSGEERRVTPPDPDNAAFIEHCRLNGTDLLRREEAIFQKSYIPIDPVGHHPHSISSWLHAYPEMM